MASITASTSRGTDTGVTNGDLTVDRPGTGTGDYLSMFLVRGPGASDTLATLTGWEAYDGRGVWTTTSWLGGGSDGAQILLGRRTTTDKLTDGSEGASWTADFSVAGNEHGYLALRINGAIGPTGTAGTGVGAYSTGYTNGGSITLLDGALSYADGDFATMYIVVANGASVTTPTGFTQYGSYINYIAGSSSWQQYRIYCYYRTYSGSGSINPSVGITGQSSIVGFLVHHTTSSVVNGSTTTSAPVATVTVPTPGVATSGSTTTTAPVATVTVPTPGASSGNDGATTTSAPAVTVTVPTPGVVAAFNADTTTAAPVVTVTVPTPTTSTQTNGPPFRLRRTGGGGSRVRGTLGHRLRGIAGENVSTTTAAPVVTMTVPTPGATTSAGSGEVTAPTVTVTVPTPGVATSGATTTSAPAVTVTVPTPAVDATNDGATTTSAPAVTVTVPTPGAASDSTVNAPTTAPVVTVTVPTPGVTADSATTTSAPAVTVTVPTPGAASDSSAGTTATAPAVTVTVPTPGATAVYDAAVTVSAAAVTVTVGAASAATGSRRIRRRARRPDLTMPGREPGAPQE